MTVFQSIVLGVVEGLTEFLPISSTAHMKFINPLLGVETGDLSKITDPVLASKIAFNEMFEVVIQLAAILAVVLLYYKKFFDFKRINFYWKLIIGVIPALVVGYFGKKYIDQALGNLTFIACVMIGGGILLLFIEKLFKNPVIQKEEQITTKNALVVGCFQVLSIIFPGLSRSAATIIGGLQQKFTRSVAAEFSFFLAVPTMLAASVKSFYDTCKSNYLSTHHLTQAQAKSIDIHTKDILGSQNLGTLFTPDNIVSFIVGCTISFIVALIAVKLFIGVVKRYGFPVWGIYRIVVGGIMLALLLTGKIQ